MNFSIGIGSGTGGAVYRCAAAVLLLLLAHLNGVYTVAFSHTIADSRKHFRRFLQRTAVSLASQNALDSVGWRGGFWLGAAYWQPARYRKGQSRVGNGYPANKHGISSAGLYHVHGCRLRGLAVRVFPACGLLVGGPRSERLFCYVERSFWRPFSCPSKGSLLIHRRSPAI